MNAEEKFWLLMKTQGLVLAKIDEAHRIISDLGVLLSTFADETSYSASLANATYADAQARRQKLICADLKIVYNGLLDLKRRLGSLAARGDLDNAMDYIREFAWRAKDEAE